MRKSLLAAGLSVGVLVAPAAAVAPMNIVPTGRVVVDLAPGCLARLVNGSYKKALPASGRTEVPAATYKLQVRPSTCVPNKKKLVVRKGKKVFAKVVNDAAPLPVPES